MSEKEEAIEEFLKIPGINRHRAELLLSSGYSSLEDLKKADPQDLMDIPGIGEKTVEKIRDYLEQTDGHWYTGGHADVGVCPVCGSMIPAGEGVCPTCGVKIDALEIDEDFENELNELISDSIMGEEGEKREGEHDGYWYKERKNGLLICPVCGSFVDEDAESCVNCGAVFEKGEEETGAGEGEAPDYWYRDRPSLFVCPLCGSFVNEDADSCPSCGAVFEGEEELEPVPAPELTEEERSRLFICPSCGAFVDAGAESCPNCGVVFEGEEEVKGEATPEAEPEIEELYVCPECGNISASKGECPVCAAGLVPASSLSVEERDVLESPEGFSICPVCGAFVSNDADSCHNCGAIFEGGEETDIEEYEPELLAEEEGMEEEKILEPEMIEEISAGSEPDDRIDLQYGESSRGKSITRDIMSRWSRVSESRDEEPILEALKKDSELEERDVAAADLRESIRYYDDILSKNPELAAAWEAKGELLAKAGYYPEAIESFERAAELRPEMEDSYKRTILEILSRNKGNGSLKIEDETDTESIERALERFIQLLEMEPENAKLWQITGELLEKLGRSEQALKAFDRAISLSSRKIEVEEESRNNISASLGSEPNSRAGRTNGLVNGNGHTNGTRGRTNGMINGNGMVNGRGRTNGMMGRVNGLINGNGRTNGLVNGVGLVNGKGLINGNGLLDSRGNLLRRPQYRSDFWSQNRSVVAVGVLLILLLPVLFNLFLVPAPGGFQVDGNFSEWSDVIGFDDPTGDIPIPALDISAVKSHLIGDTLALYASTESAMFDVPDAETVYFFVDSDSNASTGYLLDRDFGADYMASITGWDGIVQRSVLYSFDTTRNRNDWNGFSVQGTIPAASSGNQLETRFYLLQTEQPRIRAFAVNSTLATDMCEADLSPGLAPFLLLERSGTAGVVSRGEEYTPLILDIRNGDLPANITGLNLTLGPGTVPGDIGEVRVLLDNGDMAQDEGDIQVATGTFEGSGLHLDVWMNPLEDHSLIRLYVTATVSNSAVPGHPVSLRVSGVEGVGIAPTLRSQLSGGVYVDFAPGITIDGSFADWGGVPSNTDPSGDVQSGIGVVSRNIDILDSRVYPSANISFYMLVGGRVLGGTDIPNLVNRSATPNPLTEDTDGDTVPDVNETGYAYDFNNDGIPDSETTHDVDADGIMDYPYGDDYWLNTTIPPDFPEPWAGRHVSRYIGPVVLPELIGMDRIISYVDTDDNISTGNYINGIGADRMVLVAGRNGMMMNASVYSFNASNSFPWSYDSSSVEAAIAYRQIEFSVPSSILGVSAGQNISVVTSAEDWLGGRDYQDNPIGGEVMNLNGGTRADTVTKTLHMHSDDTLDTLSGDSDTTLRIRDGRSHTWTQSPAFSKDFHISGNVVAHIYIDSVDNWPTTPSLYVDLMDGGNTVASTGRSVSSTGWYDFDMGTVDYTFAAGSSAEMQLRIPSTLGTTSVTVAYDSQNHDSRLDMETDTYIHVDYVSTANDTSETSIFRAGEIVRVTASVSDPFGSYDISSASITITDPAGNPLVSAASMEAGETNTSSVLYYYNYSLGANADAGEYGIDVTATESNGVTDTGTGDFTVMGYAGVMLGPDSFIQTSPDTTVSHNITLKNIGESSDTYELTAEESSMSWKTELWSGGEMIGNDTNGDGTWDWVNPSYDSDSDGTPEITLSSLQSRNLTVKKYVPPSTEGLSDTTVINAVSESNSSVSDSASIATSVPTSSPTKSLHLHSGDGMDTFVGTSATSTTISNGETHTWAQTDPFQTDFNITGSLTAYLYISPTEATGLWGEGAPDVTVDIYYDGGAIGSASISDLTESRLYTFGIPISGTVTIPEGDRISVNISVSSAAAGLLGSDGYIDLHYDSPDYDSRIVMPTDTYVDVKDVRTFNQTSETDVFHGGEDVSIIGTISDPFGYGDIAGANITVLDPNNNVLIPETPMTFLNGSGALANFSYSFSLDNDSMPGTYKVYITGIESNGVTDTGEGQFIIPGERGVSVYPDQTKEAGPNDLVSFPFSVRNTGNLNDTYELSVSASTQGWRTELWDGGTEIAYDSDGDGTWDWVSSTYDGDGNRIPEMFITSLDTVNLTMKKAVPEDAGSVSDTTKLIATSTADGNITDSGRATINCPLAYPTKTLHLHSDDSLTTFQGSSTATIQISNGETHTWTQSPEMALDFNMTSYLPVYLYIDPTAATGRGAQGNPDVTVQISYGGNVIGSDTIADISSSGLHIFSITPASNVTVPAGDAITIEVSVSSAAAGRWGSDGYIDLYYDSPDYDSRMETSTDTVVKVEDIRTYNGSVETSIFAAGDTVSIVSRVSDPLGAQDISGAQIHIINPAGEVLADWENMSLDSTDSATPPAWNDYSYDYSFPSDAPVGTYQVDIKGIESNGVVAYLSTEFYIPANMTVEPDNNGTASAGQTITYTHWVNNTGKGADIYRFRLTSSNGFKVSLLASSGDLMGYDSDGNGVWDYVNPAYDTDGDGIPDTGLMLPGSSKEVQVQIEIPANTTATTEITVITAESMHVSLSDSATDVTKIPEFKDVLIPIGFVLVLFVVRRRRKN